MEYKQATMKVNQQDAFELKTGFTTGHNVL